MMMDSAQLFCVLVSASAYDYWAGNEDHNYDDDDDGLGQQQ